PGELVAADAQAVADRTAIAQHVIEVGVRRIDDDGARGLLGDEGDLLTAQVRRQLRRRRIGLLFWRQRGNGQRPSIRSSRWLRLYGAGDGLSRPDRSRRTRRIGIAIALVRIALVRIALVRIALVRIALVRIALVRIALVRIALIR